VAVVLTYGRRARHLDRVLDGLACGSVRPDLAIVIDNGGGSDVDKNRPRGLPVRWLDLPENLGSAGGYRAGLVAAGACEADIWLLDDDNLPDPRCLEALLAARRGLDERAIVVAHRPVRPEFQEIVARGGSRPLRPQSFMAFHWLGTPPGHHLAGIAESRSGCLPLAYFGYGGALVPRETVRRSILPEAALFVYHDDSDWSHRLLAAGFSAWLAPGAHIEDLEASWGGSTPRRASPLFSASIPSERAWYAVRNRAWVERRLGFGGSAWHLNAAIWIVLQGLRSLVWERDPLGTWKRVALIAKAFRKGAAGRLDPPPARSADQGRK